MKTARSVIAHRRQRGDAGMAFMVELLIVMAIVVGLVAIVGPKFMDYLNRGQDTAVQSDLKNYATTAEANLISNGGSSYGDDEAAFAQGASGVPVASKDNKYRAFTVGQGTNAGYVILGINRNSEKAWAVSSYNGGSVVRYEAGDGWAAFDTHTPAVGGDLKAPTGLSAAITWGPGA